MKRVVVLLLAMGSAACNSPVKVELSPSVVELRAKGQMVKLHATPKGRNDVPMPQHDCKWSSSDDKIATVTAVHNEATVTAVADGSAQIRCQLGNVVADAPVVSRFAVKVTVNPDRPVLQILDEATPTRLTIEAFDSQGRKIEGRPALVKCQNENVCRGDTQSGLWAVSPGDSPVLVKVDDASTEIVATVVDARTKEGKPQPVKGNPMEHIDREYGGKKPR
jgi:hypothetical protein